MKVISISNIKGGVAKTTTAATLAAGLNKRGYKVLMIDSDPQMNLTMCFTHEPEE
ncbi:CobQ/CobB/MinD/ParA nucleotide binding domain-containing protein, partial [Lachnospiraceae bacterium XPB1003]